MTLWQDSVIFHSISLLWKVLFSSINSQDSSHLWVGLVGELLGEEGCESEEGTDFKPPLTLPSSRVSWSIVLGWGGKGGDDKTSLSLLAEQGVASPQSSDLYSIKVLHVAIKQFPNVATLMWMDLCMGLYPKRGRWQSSFINTSVPLDGGLSLPLAQSTWERLQLSCLCGVHLICCEFMYSWHASPKFPPCNLTKFFSALKTEKNQVPLLSNQEHSLDSRKRKIFSGLWRREQITELYLMYVFKFSL